MTTYTFTGIAVEFNEQSLPISGAPTTLEIVTPDNDTTFTYSYGYTQFDPEDTAADIVSNFYSVTIAGGELGYSDEYYSNQDIIEINWSTNNTTYVFTDFNSDNGLSSLFYIGGDTLPALTTLAEFTSFFFNSVTGFGPVQTGAFAPGQTIDVATIAGASITEHDVIIGTDFDDVYDAGLGNDQVEGGSGHDTLDGGVGNDRLLGHDGNDSLMGGDGADTLNAGSGDDFIFGGDSTADLADVIFGGDGHDSVDAGYGNDNLYGGAGNDSMAGGFGADTLAGQDGDDVLTGSAFGDLISGNAGADFINGGFGHDRVNGGDDADRFFHIGIKDHGSDWIQDYDAAEGDVLVFGNGSATAADFQINYTNTDNAGDSGVEEAFIIYKPTAQIMWALVDGAGQDEINIRIAGVDYDLMV